jgi:hypothetical protein
VNNYDTPYDPNMRGVLFKNDKEGKEKRPDYRGSCVIDNVDFNISVWIMKSKKTGNKFMALKFEKKGEGQFSRTGQPVKQQKVVTEDNWADDDIF